MPTRPPQDLPEFLERLSKKNDLCIVQEEVDPNLELPEIHRRVLLEQGKALFFQKVRGSPFPVVTNLFGTEERVRMAFPNNPEKAIFDLVSLLHSFPPSLKKLWSSKNRLLKLLKLGTKKSRPSGVTENEMPSVDLEKIPFLKTWPEDGGHFLTLPLVYTEHPEKKIPNLGMYRIQRFDKNTTGLHFQIAKGGGFHYSAAEALNQNLPVSIFLGGPPALMLAAIMPLPENIPETLFASFLLENKLRTTAVEGHTHKLFNACEFALLGYSEPHKRRLEGPFGDHFGYYSLDHEFPVFHCTKVFHRKNAIFPATVVGKPPQEDLFLGNFLQELLQPLIKMAIPQALDLHTYAETGFHPLAAVRTRERYEKEAITTAFRVFGEGQLSLTKCLIVIDQPIGLRNIKEVLITLLERVRPEQDVFIFNNVSNDTLDYTGPKLNHGSKLLLLGLGDKRRSLPTEYSSTIPSPLYNSIPFCPGCLVIDGPSYEAYKDPSALLECKEFEKWPLIILVDDAKKTTENSLNFLWTVFTRFDPAQDTFFAATRVERKHLVYGFPMLIDARMKPHYPKEVLVDEQTEALVSKKWKSYFG